MSEFRATEDGGYGDLSRVFTMPSQEPGGEYFARHTWSWSNASLLLPPSSLIPSIQPHYVGFGSDPHSYSDFGDFSGIGFGGDTFGAFGIV